MDDSVWWSVTWMDCHEVLHWHSLGSRKLEWSRQIIFNEISQQPCDIYISPRGLDAWYPLIFQLHFYYWMKSRYSYSHRPSLGYNGPIYSGKVSFLGIKKDLRSCDFSPNVTIPTGSMCQFHTVTRDFILEPGLEPQTHHIFCTVNLKQKEH